MTDEVTPSPAQGTEDAPAVAPNDFREYSRWRSTGELPEQKDDTTPAAADETPPAKTDPDSEPGDSQEAGDEKDEPQEGDEGAPAKGRGGSRQRRIDKLTREIEELKRQVAEREIRSLKPQDKPSEPAQSAPGKPKLEDFSTLEQYQEALTDWKLDERERLQREKQARDATEQALRAEQDGWKAKERAARKAHPDYDDLMDTVEIPAGPGVLAARQAMLENEDGAELLYYLARHPKELERIAQLSPASAVMAIGRLSASLSPASPENGKPKITGAPKPPPPSGRQGKVMTDDPNDPEVQKDFPRWAKAREAQLKGR
jgi:hypothetical protein